MGTCFSCNNCGACKVGLGSISFINCPACGKPVMRGDDVCGSCGATIDAAMFVEGNGAAGAVQRAGIVGADAQTANA